VTTNMLDLSEANFDQTTSQESVVLVQCWAPWCRACAGQDSAFAKVAARHPEHLFARLNTEEAEGIVTRVGIEHIPALLVYRQGLLLFMQPGQFEEEELESIVSQAASLDMELVRADMSAEDAGES
jgi:thioredoxin 1